MHGAAREGVPEQHRHPAACSAAATGSPPLAGLSPGWLSEPAGKHVLQIEQNTNQKDLGSLPALPLRHWAAAAQHRPALGQPGKAVRQLSTPAGRQVLIAEQMHPGRLWRVVLTFSILFLGQLLPKPVCLQERYNHLYFFWWQFPGRWSFPIALYSLLGWFLRAPSLAQSSRFISLQVVPTKQIHGLGNLELLPAHVSLSRMTAASLPSKPSSDLLGRAEVTCRYYLVSCGF